MTVMGYLLSGTPHPPEKEVLSPAPGSPACMYVSATRAAMAPDFIPGEGPTDFLGSCTEQEMYGALAYLSGYSPRLFAVLADHVMDRRAKHLATHGQPVAL